jgi:hypothetical protein
MHGLAIFDRMNLRSITILGNIGPLSKEDTCLLPLRRLWLRPPIGRAFERDKYPSSL